MQGSLGGDATIASATERTSGVKFPPPLIYIAGFGVGLLLNRVLPIVVLPRAVALLAGGALMLGSVVFAITAMRVMWRSGTSIIPTRPTKALVIEGPFKFTRNPMYLGT